MDAKKGAKFTFFKIGDHLFNLDDIPVKKFWHSLRLGKRLAGYQDYPVDHGTFYSRGQMPDYKAISVYMVWSKNSGWFKAYSYVNGVPHVDYFPGQ